MRQSSTTTVRAAYLKPYENDLIVIHAWTADLHYIGYCLYSRYLVLTR